MATGNKGKQFMVALAILAALVIAARMHQSGTEPATTAQSTAPPPVPAPVAAPDMQPHADLPAIVSNWRYPRGSDAMSSKQMTAAVIESSDTFEFGFPYKGAQHATLTLRKHPRIGNDVMFSIERGQILCGSYNCSIRIRFDEAPAIGLTGIEPEDNDSTTVFIPAWKTMMAKLPTAKKLRVEFTAFHEGTRVVTFDVAGFDAKKF